MSQSPTGALWSVLGQNNLFHIASVYPAEMSTLNYIMQCTELAHYMFPVALEYSSGDWNGLRVYRPARDGQGRASGYKTVTEYLYLYLLILAADWSISLCNWTDLGFLHCVWQLPILGVQYLTCIGILTIFFTTFIVRTPVYLYYFR